MEKACRETCRLVDFKTNINLEIILKKQRANFNFKEEKWKFQRYSSTRSCCMWPSLYNFDFVFFQNSKVHVFVINTRLIVACAYACTCSRSMRSLKFCQNVFTFNIRLRSAWHEASSAAFGTSCKMINTSAEFTPQQKPTNHELNYTRVSDDNKNSNW